MVAMPLRSLVVLIAASSFVLTVTAAPSSALPDDPSAGANASADGRQASTGQESSAISSGNGTVDRLLNSNDDSGRPRKTLVEGTLPAKFTAAASAAAPSPLADLKSVILGNREPDARRQSSDPAADIPQTQRRDVGPSSNGSSNVSHDGGPRSNTATEHTGIAVTIARYVRENRLLVIGLSLLVLAMVWGAATFASHKRR